MYKKIDTSLNFAAREVELLEFWRQNKIFEKTAQKADNGKLFCLYDGPPTANGKPHIGHVVTRVMKDIIPRYKTMKGYKVLRKAGWDTHGLPVELEVEKQLGIDGKPGIEKYGIEPFIKKCKESVWKYKNEWEKMTQRVAYWIDMDDPYITYDDKYIESVWWSLKTIFDKGLIYQGHKIVPYCPRCGTALSSHEVAQGYKDVKEDSIIVKFPVSGENDTFFLAWTTTPWTLPSNVALCVNPDEEYVKITNCLEAGKGKENLGKTSFWLAKALAEKLFEKFEIIETRKGKQLEKMKYIPLFDYIKEDNAFFVTCDKYVTLTEGTGIVHIAPAFGEDDSVVGKKYGLPFVQLVNDRGQFCEQAYDFKGLFVKTADPLIIKNLNARGLLFKKLAYEHSYPFCWRCDTPLLYYARKSWFIKMTEVKEQILKSNNSVNWIPSSIGSGRMGNFLENIVDWGISRERYWGTPLPIWVCGDCGKAHAIGSKSELKELCGIKGNIELHRPYVDNCTFKCKCGGTAVRTPEVVDCWYDSGAMPFAQQHYPFENREAFEKSFPADYISEAVDQTRGWFYTLLAVSTLLFNKSPFENCMVLGHVNDKNGVKMSKHLGNVIDPWTVLDKQGADAVRWYFYTSSAPWLPSRFYKEAVSEAQRKFLGTLWNTYAFFVLYADIDNFNPLKYSLKDIKSSPMDKWLLSELNSLIKFVDNALENYQIFEAGRKIEEFTDNLSNWYVRRSRERFWGSEMTEDKKAAFVTLNHVLVTLSKLIAPFVPFISEEIYRNLVCNFDKDAPVSVHLSDFPKCDESMIDAKLQNDMGALIDIVVLGRSARNAANIKNKQPLSSLFVMSDKKYNFSKGMVQIIAEELNIKEVKFVSDTADFIGYELKPQLKTIGPKYGALLGKIKEYLTNCNAKAVVDTVKSGKTFKAQIGGSEVEFTQDDLLISTVNKSGFEAVSDKGIAVALDTKLTEGLIDEGFARELISKIQTMRKESGFNVTDHIKLEYQASGRVKSVFEKFGKQIASETLCDHLKSGKKGEFVKELDINGETATIALTVVTK